MKSIISLFLLSFFISFSAVANVNTKAKQAYLLDYETGAVLFQKNAQEKMVPSSMTKLMTAYVVFERLHNDVLKLDDEFRVSKKAWKMGGSKMFLRHTERVKIDDLLRGAIIQSGNDACITLAEGIASSEDAFADIMNEKAKDLGLKNTHFKNATGWPDEGHYMSAEDIAILGSNIIKNFGEYYHYYSQRSFEHAGITQNNRNGLLGRYEGADGLKTGFTDAGGYGMAVSAKRGDTRLVVVVNGLSNEREREAEAEKLLNYGFRYFESEVLYEKGGYVAQAPVWMGEEESVILEAATQVKLLLPKLKKDDVRVEISYNSPIAALIKKGDIIAKAVVKLPNMPDANFDLMAANDVEKLSGLSKILYNLKQKMSAQ